MRALINGAKSNIKYPSLRADSQNLRGNPHIKNNPCEAPENLPASWCKKSESKGAVVRSADFLLEAESRGSPPKSEKWQLLGTHFKKVRGSGAGGAALLREKSSKNSGDGGAESRLDSVDSAILSQDGLPRATCCARNDDFLSDSAESQNLWEKSNKKSLLKFLLLFAFAKRRVPLNHINFNPSSKADSQNLAEKIANIFTQK